MCRQPGRSNNADWQNATTHHQPRGVRDSLTPEVRSIERNKTNIGEGSRENKERLRRKRMHKKLPGNVDENWSIINIQIDA
jgi:hypothetical protein